MKKDHRVTTICVTHENPFFAGSAQGRWRCRRRAEQHRSNPRGHPQTTAFRFIILLGESGFGAPSVSSSTTRALRARVLDDHYCHVVRAAVLKVVK